jgi:DNA-binding transcriptional regulator LsrR (DeoR family)
MIEREEHQLILDVAVKYYLEDKTQNQIAKELYISRSKVSRLLKKAKDNRIVEINIIYVLN